MDTWRNNNVKITSKRRRGVVSVDVIMTLLWASYQIRKIAGCACTGNAGNVFPRHRLQRKPSDPDMQHGTCVTHVPCCMSGSQTPGGGENVPGIPGACATRNFPYLTRGPLHGVSAEAREGYSNQCPTRTILTKICWVIVSHEIWVYSPCYTPYFLVHVIYITLFNPRLDTTTRHKSTKS